MLILWGLVACVTVEGGERAEREICDDGVDNDGDGLIDCDDTDSCGGIPCQGVGADTGGSGEPVEIVIEGRRCCDFTFNAGNCNNRSAGTLDVINRTDNDGLITSIRCERKDQIIGIPVGFRVDPLSDAKDALADVELPANSTVTVEAVFDCQTEDPFTVSCEAKAVVGPLGDERGFIVRGAPGL